jgi:UDP-N-acetylmuramate: L-alanyl-gamma-D-glutamyl-meso-diaminopimelate ligase
MRLGASATQGATTHTRVTQEEITARIAASGIHAIALPEANPVSVVGETLRADDVVLLLTSGALGGLIETLPAFAERIFPA